MKREMVIWRTALRASANAFLRDRRVRGAKLIALLMQVGSGIWVCTYLFFTFIDWQSANVLTGRLWLACMTAWSSIALFSIIATFQYGLNSNEALLLAAQPIAPATRLRALYGLVVLKGSSDWLLWETGVFGVALTRVLGWSALPWLATLIVGAALMVWLALLATLLTLRFIMPHLRVVLGSLVGLLALCGLLVLVLHATKELPMQLASGLARSGMMRSLAAPSPALTLLALLLMLLSALLPLAHMTGRLYYAALLRLQDRTDMTSTLTLPGIRLLIALLAHSRTMSAALLSKGLLNQSRHFLAWIRLLVLFTLLALFAPLRASLNSLHLALPVLVGVYATLVAALTLVEYAPYAISSEGNRLALYLTIPLGVSSFLRARLCSFLLPALLIGCSSALLLGLWTHLSLLDLGLALLLALLALIGYTIFTVLGSALDEDLSLAIEDRAQALMQEELPITPRRMQLLSLSVALLALCFLLISKTPPPVALPILTSIDIVIALLMWHLSTIYLARLSR